MKIRKLTPIAVLTVAIISPLAISSAAGAWEVRPQVGATCENGEVTISGTFNNEEPADSGLGMFVTLQTPYGSDGPKTVQPGENETFTVATDQSSIGDTSVSYNLTWANGSDGSDQRTLSVSSLTCPAVVPPTPAPTPAPSPTPAPAPAPVAPIVGPPATYSAPPPAAPVAAPVVTVTPHAAPVITEGETE